MTFCGAVVSLKVMDQNFNNAFGEFARHEFTNLSLETLPDTLSLSLTGIRLSPKQERTGYALIVDVSEIERVSAADE